MKELKNFKTALEEFINNTLDNKSKQLGVYVVTSINDDKTVNIKELTSKNSYSNVNIVSGALGNGKGLFVIPDVNDIVLVAFIGGNKNNPIILGNVFDTFSQNPDNKPPISKDEVFISNKNGGSYIYIKSNGDVVVKTGAGKFIFGNNGSFSLPNYTFPADDGSAGQVLKTNGAGILSWSNDNVS